MAYERIKMSQFFSEVDNETKARDWASAHGVRACVSEGVTCAFQISMEHQAVIFEEISA